MDKFYESFMYEAIKIAMFDSLKGALTEFSRVPYQEAVAAASSTMATLVLLAKRMHASDSSREIVDIVADFGISENSVSKHVRDIAAKLKKANYHV